MNNLSALAPFLTVVAAALLILILEAFLKREKKSYLGFLSIPFLAAAAFFCILSWDKDYSAFGGHLILDRFAAILILAFVLTAFFIVLMSLKYLTLQDMDGGEYYALLLLAVSGMMIMVSSGNLLVIFLGLEVLSISSYALTGMKRKDWKSSEAAMKYFLMGSFASAFLILGLAFLHGSYGNLEIESIVSAGTPSPIGAAGLILVIVAFGFKIALVPFHMWAPDVYEGAPMPVTSFLSIGPKLSAVAVLFRLLGHNTNGGPEEKAIGSALWAIAALTMLVGNLAALRQKNLKRILAYSSIAHSGYLLLGILAGDGSSVLFYLIVYLFMNAGAFSAFIAISQKEKECTDLEELAGIGFRYPWIGASLSVILFSLAGFPPTAGFLAKFYVFSAAVREGYSWLVVIAVMASLVSVFYYLRIIVFMYMKEAHESVLIDSENPGPHLVLFLSLYAVIQLGILPGNLLNFVRQAVESLF